MKKFNIDFPIAGVLHFSDVEADTKKEAIDKCYELVAKSDNPIYDFDGEWEMYTKIAEGNVLYVNDNRVSVEETSD